MSGHNKWSKIKHKKAATDAERSKIFSKHALLITMESRQAGGDPLASGLASAIERAKKDSMPKENIERAIAKGSGQTGPALSPVLFETFGPGGVAVLISAITDNNNRTSQEIKHLLVKQGYVLGAPGSAVWAFTKIDQTTYSPLTLVTQSHDDREALYQLTEALLAHADVQAVFTGADIE